VSELPTERIGRDRFGALYEENYHLILGYAPRRAGGDEATDVVAEIFLVAWRRLEEIRPARRRVSGFMQWHDVLSRTTIAAGVGASAFFRELAPSSPLRSNQPL
jgi:DNA-directed RNA polymerase specialized sigma24 family protein